MWREIDPFDGTLTYTFAESVKAKTPYYMARLFGGLLYFGGMLIMFWNVIKTIQNKKLIASKIPEIS
jgi:cytochrome c oxidase cbb3-type subunit 1